MKNQLILATAIALVSMNTAYASINQPVPDKCPSVAALTQSPLTLAQIDFKTNTYVAAAFNNTYDTNVTWTLVIGSIQAEGAQDAIKIATADIPQFVLVTDTPQQFYPMNAWGCGYQSDKGFQVLAVTSSSSLSNQSLSSLLMMRRK